MNDKFYYKYKNVIKRMIEYANFEYDEDDIFISIFDDYIKIESYKNDLYGKYIEIKYNLQDEVLAGTINYNLYGNMVEEPYIFKNFFKDVYALILIPIISGECVVNSLFEYNQNVYKDKNIKFKRVYTKK